MQLVDDGGFRLDGGAMFGVVPRVLWERQKPADSRNRIAMTTNCLLVERGQDLLLIDAGIGDKHDDRRFYDQFGMPADAVRLPEQISQAGYELGDITHVLPTHLHFDHCGWLTREIGGELRPTFPNARYWLQRDELLHARQPNARDRASYDARNWEPLLEAGVVELFDDHARPIEGVEAVRAPGHNADMCIVLLDGGEAAAGEVNKAVFWADLVPTTAHLPYPWVMGFDLYPLDTMANKERWLPRAAAEDWWCFFCHEVEHPIGKLRQVKPGRYQSVVPPAIAEAIP